MAIAPEGMTLLTIEPRNYDKIIELSQNTPNPYTREELEQIQARHHSNNSAGIVMFMEPDFWTRERKFTPREEFQNVFGPINDDQWQWLKEFTERNYDAQAWLRGVQGYRHVPTDRIFHPSEMEIIR